VIRFRFSLGFLVVSIQLCVWHWLLMWFSIYGSALWYNPRSDSDFDVKFSTVQFYTIKHNSKSNYWIELKLYQMIPEVFFYIRVNFQVNQSSERTCDIGQNRLYEFCYLLPFDLWTFYLVIILFVKRCGSLFWEFFSSTRIFNELQHNFQEWQGFRNISRILFL